MKLYCKKNSDDFVSKKNETIDFQWVFYEKKSLNCYKFVFYKT